ncbi:hypothetical protein SLOPH_957 [Spraguea lophii 42_110]|uniref:Uncharacterized protein n=1 Tax=Spraguea lophii (strain 42_110) TaxID=1358809 RepID=S7W7V5_SPRLO|nr:hypothetical protein SLOPH_957 [Spraguea lophii 42_110]
MTFVKARYYKYDFGKKVGHSISTMSTIDIFSGVGLAVIAISLLVCSFMPTLLTSATFIGFMRYYSLGYIILFVLGQGYKIIQEDSADKKQPGFLQYILLVLGTIVALLGALFLIIAHDEYIYNYIHGLFISLVTYFNMVDIWSGQEINSWDVFVTSVTMALLVGGIIAEFCHVPVLGLCIVLVLFLQVVNYIFLGDQKKKDNDICQYLPAVFALISVIAALYIWFGNIADEYPWLRTTPTVPVAGSGS